MATRPKIKLTLAPVDKRLELLCKIFVLVVWVLTVYSLATLPAIIPTHFNAAGKPDRHGSKQTLLVLPLLATALYFVLTHLNKYPHIFNYMTRITPENAHQQYLIATRMLRFLKLTMLLVFALLILFIYVTAIGATGGLGTWFLPTVIGLFLIPTIITIWQALKKGNATEDRGY